MISYIAAFCFSGLCGIVQFWMSRSFFSKKSRIQLAEVAFNSLPVRSYAWRYDVDNETYTITYLSTGTTRVISREALRTARDPAAVIYQAVSDLDQQSLRELSAVPSNTRGVYDHTIDAARYALGAWDHRGSYTSSNQSPTAAVLATPYLELSTQASVQESLPALELSPVLKQKRFQTSREPVVVVSGKTPRITVTKV